MKLYLSSFRLGLHTETLLRLVGGEGATTCVAHNALDHLGPLRAERADEEMLRLREIGLIPEELDLRSYESAPESLRERLERYQLVWVRGGNSFVLRQAMVMSGFDVTARPLIESGNLVYGGYSAGVCVVTPTLKGIELVDDPNEVAESPEQVNIWDGMGLIDYSVAPHFRSDHPESEAIEKVVSYFEKEKMPHRALRDGEVVLVDGDESQLLGM
jgi:dipeptidase E